MPKSPSATLPNSMDNNRLPAAALLCALVLDRAALVTLPGLEGVSLTEDQLDALLAMVAGDLEPDRLDALGALVKGDEVPDKEVVKGLAAKLMQIAFGGRAPG
ncbi:MAG: hypothetical protein Q9211_007143, partial [Gyalolechia sp. 1 TL-2023]